MQKIKRLSVLFLTLITSVGCDQATKRAAQMHLNGRAPRSYFNNMLRLEYTENPGAFLNLGARFSAEMQFWIFTVAVGIILLLLFSAMLNFSYKGQRALSFALALYLGGGIGNLLDRVLHGGRVIDFLNVGVGSIRTGIFNVADMVIMAGLGLLLLSTVRQRNAQSLSNAVISKSAKEE